MKGKRVVAKAIVRGSYHPSYQWTFYSGSANDNRYRSVYRKEEKVTGICLGKSYLCEGYINIWSSYDVAEFMAKKRHAVYVIEPGGIEKDRYYKPVRALIEDVREEK